MGPGVRRHGIGGEMTQEKFRAIPPINELLDTPTARLLAERTSRDYVRDRLRDLTAEIRTEIAAGRLDPSPGAVVREAETRLAAREGVSVGTGSLPGVRLSPRR